MIAMVGLRAKKLTIFCPCTAVLQSIIKFTVCVFITHVNNEGHAHWSVFLQRSGHLHFTINKRAGCRLAIRAIELLRMMRT